MKLKILLVLLFTGLLGCNNPNEFPLLDSFKPADNFARGFIDNITNGQSDSCFAKVTPENLNDTVKNYFADLCKRLNGARVKKYKIVEENGSTAIVSNNGYSYYRLGYECEFDRGFILFTTTVRKNKEGLSILSFHAQPLQFPLAEATKFTLRYRSFGQYLFLFFVVITPLFIIASTVFMLISKIPKKKKIIWSLIILFISMPRFVMNWGTGQMDYNIFFINFLGGAGVNRVSLYSYWLLSFNIPIGAIMYWIRRRKLLAKPLPASASSESSEVSGQDLTPDGES